MNADAQKRAAAARALDYVTPGMRLGLGTGSTAKHFVDLVGERVRAGLDIVAVPTSEATHAQAIACGIRLTTLDETPALDLTVDGADEIGPDLSLIKGGGGALLREKIVAAASTRMVVIADASKWVAQLGQFALPIEVTPFGYEATRRAVGAAITAIQPCGPLTLRKGQERPCFRHGWGPLDNRRRAVPNRRSKGVGASTFGSSGCDGARSVCRYGGDCHYWRARWHSGRRAILISNCSDPLSEWSFDHVFLAGCFAFCPPGCHWGGAVSICACRLRPEGVAGRLAGRQRDRDAPPAPWRCSIP